MRETLTREIELGEGVSASVSDAVLTIQGPKGQVSRTFRHPRVQISVQDAKVVLSSPNATKREKTLVHSYAAHITNMAQGVIEPFTYKVRICSGHFPMNVSVQGTQLTIKNFLGESVPRKVQLIEGVQVKVEGTDIIINSSDKEAAGQVAAKIESLTRITNRDRRIFQDGCYIVEKAGKVI